MFLFPWLHYGESICNFEKSTFFHSQAIFHSVRELPRAIFDINSVDAGTHKNRKSYRKLKSMLESCKETSQLSVDSFMALQDHVVPQKSNFLKKILRFYTIKCTPPLVTRQRDITSIFLSKIAKSIDGLKKYHILSSLNDFFESTPKDGF